MPKRKNLIVVVSLLSLASSTSFGAVYQTTTSDGRVIYTDNADTAYQYNSDTTNIKVLDKLTSISNSNENNIKAKNGTVETIKTSASELKTIQNPAENSVTSSKNTTNLSTKTISPSQKGEYTLSIQTPEENMVFRRPSQNIGVSVTLNPSLKAGDRFIYRINDKTLATTTNNVYEISTDDLMPNEYTLTVNVENIVGETIATDSRIVHILPNNVVFQQKRKALKAAQEAYDKLPWYKKLKLNISL